MSETAQQSSGSNFFDMFTQLAGLYVQDRQNERNNPAAFNAYSYQALAGADNSVYQNPYANTVGMVNANQPARAATFTTEQLMLGGALLFAAYMLLK